MEHRADAVGKNAVYGMLRLMLHERAGSGMPLRFFLLGHSFGCKVICSALQDVQVDIANGTIALEPGTTFHAVLIEARRRRRPQPSAAPVPSRSIMASSRAG